MRSLNLPFDLISTLLNKFFLQISVLQRLLSVQHQPPATPVCLAASQPDSARRRRRPAVLDSDNPQLLQVDFLDKQNLLVRPLLNNLVGFSELPPRHLVLPQLRLSEPPTLWERSANLRPINRSVFSASRQINRLEQPLDPLSVPPVLPLPLSVSGRP